MISGAVFDITGYTETQTHSTAIYKCSLDSRVLQLSTL